MNKTNEIALRRRNLVIMEDKSFMNVPFPYDTYMIHTPSVNALDANLRQLGYCLSENLYEKLCNSDITVIQQTGTDLLRQIKELVGADLDYKPLYPNFPNRVMTMEESQLYTNALIHYFKRDLHHAGFNVPETESSIEYRLPMPKGNTKMTILDAGSKEDVNNIVSDLLKSNISYSKQDKKDIESLIHENKEWKNLLPEKMENKENIAMISCAVLKNPEQTTAENLKDMDALNKYIHSATDVMRIYAGLSDGDISLSEKVHFTAQPRSIRRYLLQKIDEDKNAYAQMSMRPEEFKKMFQYLHVDEFRYKNNELRYPHASEYINKIRENEKAASPTHRLNVAIKNQDIEDIISFASDEPGIFIRRLDEIIRKSEEKDYKKIKQAFSDIAFKIPTKTLLTLRERFIHRTEDKDYNLYFPKGQTAKAYVSKAPEKLDMSVCAGIIEVCNNVLISRFMDKGYLGKVYIDKNLAGYKAPMTLRNLSQESKVITRGSRIPLEENKKILRSFIWWKDDVDIDLSAVIMNGNLQEIGHISYTNLRDSFGVHSGDVTYQRANGHEGECEFIDIDEQKVGKLGGRYIAFQVNNFSGIDFCKSGCKFGYMEREKMMSPADSKDLEKQNRIYPNTGEIFEPLTVKNLMSITAQSKSVIPFVYDVVNREIIWADIAIGGIRPIHSTEYTQTAGAIAVRACLDNEAPSMLDLLNLHVAARGERVFDPREADEIFSLDKGSTPYEVEKIIARFIADGKDEYCYEALKEKAKELPNCLPQKEKSNSCKDVENVIITDSKDNCYLVERRKAEYFIYEYPSMNEISFGQAFSISLKNDDSLFEDINKALQELKKSSRNEEHQTPEKERLHVKEAER